MSLFPLHRPGLIVVSGTVTDVDGISVTVSGDVDLPVSKKTVKRFARIKFPKGFSSARMKLKVGENIIAITEDDYAIEALFQDAETPDEMYNLKSYSIRYSGVFDFEEKNGVEEQHLFSGQVINSKIVKTSSGLLTVTNIHVRVANSNEERIVVERGEVKRTKGSSIIITTKKPVYSETNIPYYPTF